MTALNFAAQTSAIYLLRNAEPYDAWFNDLTNPDNVGVLGGDDSVTGLDSPEVRENAANLVESHGGVHGNFWAGRRPITLTAQVLGTTIDNRNAMLQRLRRASNQYSYNGQLFVFPGDPSIVNTTRVNLVTNPNFEYDAAGAAPYAWTDQTDANFTTRTFAVAAANPLVGVNSLRVKGTKDATATARTLQFVTGSSSGGGTPIVPGRSYSAQVSLFIADALASGTGFNIFIQWFNGNGAFITSSGGTALATGATGRQTVSVSNAVAPTAAANAVVMVNATSTGSGDVVDVYADAAQFVAEATPGTYFDGDTANSSWLGSRGGSQSVNRPNGKMITTRRQQPMRVSGGWMKSALVSLVAADPRIYSSAQYASPAQAPGAHMDMENQGDWESPPQQIVVVGPGVNPVVKNLANGVTRQIAFTGLTLTAGQFLVIDPLNKTVIRDNGSNMYQYIDFLNTQWWGLMPGPTNYIGTDWASGTTGASTTTVRWRDAWM